MASGPIVGGNDGAREKQRYSENKVYTRKAFKGSKNQNNNSTSSATATYTANANNNNTTTVTTTATTTVTNVTTTDDTEKTNNDAENVNNSNNDENKNNKQDDKDEKDDNSIQEQPTQTLPVAEDANSAQQPVISRLDGASDDSSILNRPQALTLPTTVEPPSANGAVKSGSENRIKINLASSSKQEKRKIRRKLESELDVVRSLVKKIEAKEGQIGGGFSNLRVTVSDGIDNGVMRVQSEVASVGVPVSHGVIGRQSRPFNQLSMSTLENSQGVTENMEKEKRTPKANQFYRNSEFLLAKDKFPPAESNKKSKLNVKRHGGESGRGFGAGSKFFKSCNSLLEKLMKHKHGWVFNAPVDAEALGLHDYFTIIKHPMDLGTVKSRLNKNWYKSPKEFAEDVRLTFHNAMTYNPKGQDVHVMAELLSNMFEDRWAVIESEYNRETMFGTAYDMGFHTPAPRKAPFIPPSPLDMRRILERSESMTHPVDFRPKPISTTPSGRTPAPKKPKAKDPHKRDMTYEEKQKLSTNLQSLPSEKLDNIVQIIRKRNSSLFQHDDEIEVDIDSVDAETLWELDRFVTNYKKSLSKNKRKAELAIQARAEAEQNMQQQAPAPVVAEGREETRTEERNVASSSPVQILIVKHPHLDLRVDIHQGLDIFFQVPDFRVDDLLLAGQKLLRLWRVVPLNENRFWGTNGPESPSQHSPLAPVITGADSSIESASSLAELGALVLSTSDPLSKSKLSHLAFSKWRSLNLPIGVSVPPSQPARPPKPELVSPKEIPAPKNSGFPLNVYMLHNLAHVELNAIDLAWDTVVRFSPFCEILGEGFFADFAHVADDESRHFAWCSQRLAELGFKYGDMPAHNLLWSQCEKSSDNVAARLAVIPLVQEARGLDAGPRLVQKLIGFGDHRTSDIVATIADEEIAHVAVGVYWFLSVCQKLDRAPCSTFKDLLKEYNVELKGPFNYSARDEAGIPRDWYEYGPSSTNKQDKNQKENTDDKLSVVYDRLASIIAMESENSSLKKAS
ncbi:hypothetical protein ACOSQ3_002269 [Xanthoceras sorbifolium]